MTAFIDADWTRHARLRKLTTPAGANRLLVEAGR